MTMMCSDSDEDLAGIIDRPSALSHVCHDSVTMTLKVTGSMLEQTNKSRQLVTSEICHVENCGEIWKHAEECLATLNSVSHYVKTEDLYLMCNFCCEFIPSLILMQGAIHL